MHIPINDTTHLALLNHQHNEPLYRLIDQHREYLSNWLMFIDGTQHVNDVQEHCNESIARNKNGLEYAFVIMHNNSLVGRIGIYKIDLKNKIGDIAYWLSPEYQGKGIMLQACNALIDFAFHKLELNRLEIRCSVDNAKSIAIPSKLNFTHEGTMRKSKRMSTSFTDVKLFSLLRSDYELLNNTLP